MDTDLPSRILLLSDRHSYADQLLSQLRNEGVPLRIGAVETQAGLLARLEQEPWDLLLYFSGSVLPARESITELTRHNSGLPLICICSTVPDSGTALPLLQAGVSEFVSEDDKTGILFHIRRELQRYRALKAQRELQVHARELERRLRDLLENSTQALAYILDGMHLYCNPAYARTFGHESAAELQKIPLLDLFRGADRKALRKLLGKKTDSSETRSLRVQVQGRNEAEQHAMQLLLSPGSFDGQDCLQLSLSALAGNPDYRQALTEIKNQDLLTRLYTEDFFRERLEAAIAAAVRQQRISSLIVIQLNELLDIRSAIGQSNTNQVLHDVVDFLRQTIKKPYAGGRLDTYEFALLLDDCKTAEAVELANFIKNRINSHINATALPSLNLSCSIGIAIINEHARDADELLARARNRTGKVPEQPKNGELRIGAYPDYDMDDMLTYMEQALRERRFRLLFQPIVNIKGEKSYFYEVLSRMLDSDENDIMPDVFLPLLNLNGQAEDFDRLVFDMALSALVKSGLNGKHLLLNLTSSTLLGKTFLPWLGDCLHRHRVPAKHLIVQLNEIDIFNSPEHALEFADGLQQLDLNVAISHFGCAIDPFRHIKALRPGHIKLDKSLIPDIIYSQQHKAQVQTMLDKIHTHQARVITPNVEDADIMPLLWKMGVDYVQGHYLKRPAQAMDYPFIEEAEITLQAPPRKDS